MRFEPAFQPSDRRANVHAAQVHDQVNGTSTSDLLVPVEEFCSRDGDRTTIGMPTVSIVPIAIRTPLPEDKFQRQRTHRIGPAAKAAGPKVRA